MEEKFILRVPHSVAEQIDRLLSENASSSEDKSLDLSFSGMIFEVSNFSTLKVMDLEFPPAMGFFFHMVEIPKALTLAFLFGFWSSLKFVVIAFLNGLGLYKPAPEEDNDNSSGYHPNSYILLLDGTSPSLVPIPIHVATAAVKRKVPIVFFRDYLEKREGEMEKDRCWCCSICLEEIELDHEVRDPVTCNHVFHRPCLDTWVDEGQVTCPVCRSMLLPRKLTSFRLEMQAPAPAPDPDVR
nr:E3 ubiquitin-protein ligase RHA2A-like [Ipomoea trifida]